MFNVSVEHVSANVWRAWKIHCHSNVGFFHLHFFLRFYSTQRVTEIASHTTSGRQKTHTGKCSRRGRFMKTGNIKRRVKICQNKGGNRLSEQMSSPISRSSSRAFRDQQGDVCHSWHKSTANFWTCTLHTHEIWWSTHRHASSTQIKKHFPRLPLALIGNISILRTVLIANTDVYGHRCPVGA